MSTRSRDTGLGISTTRLVVGVISAMVEKELGTATWRRKGLLSAIVAQDCPLEPHGLLNAGLRRVAGVRRETTPGNNPFLLPFAVQAVLNIDEALEEPEASENPTQSFEIHNIIRKRKQLLTPMPYRYLCIISNVIIRYRAPGLPPEHPECSVFHCKHYLMDLPRLQAAQGHTPTLHLDPPLKNGFWKAHCGTGCNSGAVILHQG